jgi:hypothetical protein
MFIDDTLPTMNKPKHPKINNNNNNNKIQGTKWKDPHPRRQMKHI